MCRWSCTDLVDAGLADQALDMVTIAKGGGERLQNDGTNALATRVAISTGIPHAGPTSRRQHVQIALGDIHGYLSVSTAGQNREAGLTGGDSLGPKIKLVPAAMATGHSPLLKTWTA